MLARAETLDALQRDASVVGGLADLDAEALLEVLDDPRRPGEMAREVVADGNHVTSLRLLKVQRVKRDDLVDMGRRQVEEGGDVLLRLPRDVSEGVLGDVEHGQERSE